MLLIAINIGEDVCFDFEWWNELGLEYAQQLREALHDKYVLFYEYAAEDLINRWKPAVLVEKNNFLRYVGIWHTLSFIMNTDKRS